MKQQHKAEMLAALRDGDFVQTPEGVLIRGAARMRGKYSLYADGQLLGHAHNLVPLQGREYFLSAGIKGTGATTNFFLALFSGAVTPLDSWTAANFNANATEITSTTEGYASATRPAWVHGSVTAGVVAGSLASYEIVCTTNINIAGAAILTNNVRGGTAGVLISASRFDQVYTINNGATFEVGYELELSDED